ncbi:hypothetical protein [Streptomyces purpurogeneiscleroticus]|uniref:hypothetical protein n=1 Tax=Streptomyces purpurogeneiscleroticus TaxID=68259 RepID=UPI001CBB389C|nr:hypothetical protein [Streptomyces purpurogeneiscleroticus]MBZ4020013.1 hypothetical protein [Streptomyces purpurogeneiscleroticus]
MDVFALATLGFGSIATKGVKAAHTTLKTARLDRYANLRKLVDKRIMRYGADSQHGQPAMRAKQALREHGVGEVSASATTRGERLLGGDKDVVNTSKLAKSLREKYGDDAHIQKAADAADKAVRKAQVNYGAAGAVDLGDKGAEMAMGNDPYSDAKMDFDEKVKDTLTCETGSTWQHAAGTR